MSQENNQPLIAEKITIRTRGKKKTWTAEYWHNGKHHRKSLRTRNQKVAVQEATKLAAKLLEGTLPDSLKNYPVEQAIKEYLEAARLDRKAKKTMVKLEGVFKRWGQHLDSAGVRHLQQIRPTHFEAFRRQLDALLVSQRTIHNYFVIVNGLMRWAKRHKRIRENPFEDMRVPKPRRRSKPVPTMAEVNLILSHANQSDLPIFAIAAFTGARIGDIRTRYQEDLDLKGNWIKFVARDDAAPKGGKERKVPIHSRLRELLLKLPQHQRKWLFNAGPSKKFPAGDHHINDKHINTRLKAIVEKLGMKAGSKDGYTMHSFRRFFETHCINNGVPQRVVDAWMGHQSDRSMGAVYYLLNNDDSQAFMSKLQFPEEVQIDPRERKTAC